MIMGQFGANSIYRLGCWESKMGRLTPSFKTTYSEALQHAEEAIKTEIIKRDKKIQALAEMIDNLEARIKDENIVLDSNNN
jgi:(p)ppGpp synthase/HD superfamily hydrolase